MQDFFWSVPKFMIRFHLSIYGHSDSDSHGHGYSHRYDWLEWNTKWTSFSETPKLDDVSWNTLVPEGHRKYKKIKYLKDYSEYLFTSTMGLNRWSLSRVLLLEENFDNLEEQHFRKANSTYGNFSHMWNLALIIETQSVAISTFCQFMEKMFM